MAPSPVQTQAALRSLGYNDKTIGLMLAAAAPPLVGADVAQDRSGFPLAGVTVLDFSHVLAGPLCSHILAELGARVVKVENRVEKPGVLANGVFSGDILRGSPGFFAAVNHSKECVAVDFKDESDRRLLDALLRSADVLVENFRPGVMTDMGYGERELRGRFPSLVYCSISGYGHTGPDSRKPAMDVVVQARSGLMSITGHEGTPPTGLGSQLADLSGGLWGAIAVLGALFRQRRTGEGAFVDVAMLDACVSLLSPLLPRVGQGLPQPDRRGAASQHSAPFNVYKCAGGEWVAIVALQQHFWRALCRTLGLTELVDDPRFADNNRRLQNRKALEEKIEEAFLKRPAGEWVLELAAAGVPCEPVNDLKAVMADAQVLARNMVVTTADGYVVPGNPAKISGLPDGALRPASPVVDSHGDRVRAAFAGPSRL